MKPKKLLEDHKKGKKLLFKSIRRLSEAEAGKVKVTPKWNVKDVIAHLIGWKLECIKRIKLISRKKRSPNHFNYKVNKFNSKEVKKRKGKTWKQLSTELRIAENKFEKALRQAPDEEFAEGWGWNEEIGHDYYHAKQIIKARKKGSKILAKKK